MNRHCIFMSICLLAAGCQGKSMQTSLPVEDQPRSNSNQAASSVVIPPPAPPLHTVGQVTRHAQIFLNQRVRLRGYLLKNIGDYIIISDEPSGPVGRYDLPVHGDGIKQLLTSHLYEFTGMFLYNGMILENGNPDRLELEAAPVLIK